MSDPVEQAEYMLERLASQLEGNAGRNQTHY